MQNSEYEFQLFGFTTEQQSFERRIKLESIVNDALERVIRKSCSGEDTLNALLKQKSSVCQTLLSTVEDNLKSLEALDKKHFQVPGHILLESDFQHRKQQCTKEYEDNLDKQLSELTQLFLENRVFTTLLGAEVEKFQLIEPFLLEQVRINSELLECLRGIGSGSAIVSKTKELLEQM